MNYLCYRNVRVGTPENNCTIGLSSENGLLREKHAPAGRMFETCVDLFPVITMSDRQNEAFVTREIHFAESSKIR